MHLLKWVKNYIILKSKIHFTHYANLAYITKLTYRYALTNNIQITAGLYTT